MTVEQQMSLKDVCAFVRIARVTVREEGPSHQEAGAERKRGQHYDGPVPLEKCRFSAGSRVL